MRFSRLVIDGAEVSPMQMQQRGNEIWLTCPFPNEKYASLNENKPWHLLGICQENFSRSITVLKKSKWRIQPRWHSIIIKNFIAVK